MNSIQKRFVLFLFGCIVARLSLVYISKTYTSYLRFLGLVAIVISIGFFSIYITGSRKTGLETGGEPIWWNNLRPVHGLLYLLFAILALQKNEKAWVVLLVDVILGLMAFLTFHYKQGNFAKLI